MKKVICLLTFVLCFLFLGTAQGKTAAEKHGWLVAMQSYSFHKFTLVEALDKTHQLGIRYMEVYPGHKLGGKWGDTEFGPNLEETTQKELLVYAKSKDVKLVGSGVFTSNSKEEWEKMFRLAKNMGMEYITCEPALDMWDYVEQLSNQYGINVSVHNHPQPSNYWNPQNLLNAISHRSKNIGSCADVGHWCRSGLDSKECLKMLKGRIISLHFKDIAAKEPGASEQHDVIWGTGVLDVKGMMEILKDQNFKGYFAIEYEYNLLNSVPDIKKSVEYFNKTAEEIF